MEEREIMGRALALAERGRGTTSPNPMVGCVVVRDGRIVGEGFHERAGGPHAEVNALADAGDAAKGADLYVTLEPCNHHGRTPPCTEAVLAAGVRRVVAAMTDPNPGVAGGGLRYLAGKGVLVESGLLEAEAKKQNEAFIHWITQKTPFVTAKCAATLDGRIAAYTGDSKWITNEKSRAHVHELRHGSDAILVGIGTVLADDPRLTARIEGKEAKNPRRVVLDPRLQTPPEAALLRGPTDSDTLLFAEKGADPGRRKILEEAGAVVMEVPSHEGFLDLRVVMAELGRLNVTSLLIEGGAHVHGSAFRAGVVHKVCFFFAPKVLGGEGIPMTAGPGPERISDSAKLCGVSVRRFGGDVMIEAYVEQQEKE